MRTASSRRLRTNSRCRSLNNVTDINAARPHTTGECVCTACGHVWVGVVPTGMVALECPSCGLVKGIRRGHVYPEYVKTCDCGSQYFQINDHFEAICVACGETYEFP